MDAIIETYQTPQEAQTVLIDSKVNWAEGNMRLNFNYSGNLSAHNVFRATIDPKSGNYGFKSDGKHADLQNFFTITKYDYTFTYSEPEASVRIRLYTSDNVPECDIYNSDFTMNTRRITGSQLARPERGYSMYSNFNNFKIILEIYTSWGSLFQFNISGSANLVCFNVPSLIDLI